MIIIIIIIIIIKIIIMSWILLPKDKLDWVNNVMVFKVTIKALPYCFFKKITVLSLSCSELFIKTGALAFGNLSLLGKVPQRK